MREALDACRAAREVAGCGLKCGDAAWRIRGAERRCRVVQPLQAVRLVELALSALR